MNARRSGPEGCTPLRVTLGALALLAVIGVALLADGLRLKAEEYPAPPAVAPTFSARP